MEADEKEGRLMITCGTAGAGTGSLNRANERDAIVVNTPRRRKVKPFRPLFIIIEFFQMVFNSIESILQLYILLT